MSLHYLIDGFNVLYALPDFPSGTWEQKRESLLKLLQTRKPYGKNKITVIFDSREGTGNRQSHGEISVVFTPGETADDWISRYVRQVQNPRICIVVTNDQGLRKQIRGTGARSCAVEEFLKGSKSAKRQPDERIDIPTKDINDELRKAWGL